MLTAALVALMALGSLALWTAIPAGWMYVTREMEPAGARFVLTIFGCVASMVGAGSLLYRLEAVYFRVSGSAVPAPAPPSFLRTAGDARTGRPRLGLLDTFMAASAVVALLALLLWWALLADSPNPSGPLQPALTAAVSLPIWVTIPSGLSPTRSAAASSSAWVRARQPSAR